MVSLRRRRPSLWWVPFWLVLLGWNIAHGDPFFIAFTAFMTGVTLADLSR